MEIPVLSRFIKGLKLFFSTKGMRWLTFVFLLSVFLAKITEAAAPWLQSWGAGAVLILILGGALPTFFFLATIVSLFGFQKFIVSDESYLGSIVRFPIWYIVSLIVLFSMLITGVMFQLVFVIFGFLGWIVFQAYLASRSSLRYAESVTLERRGKLMMALYTVIYFFNYVVVIGAFIFTLIVINPAILASLSTVAIALIGTLFACGFNFINGMIQIRERKKRSIDNVSLLGLFISLYSAYFIYNVLSGPSFGNPIAMLPEIILSVFFILYAISNVGLTVTSRAEMDTRWKISKETGGAFTFFLASSYSYVIILYIFIFPDPIFAASLGDSVKLLLFPLVALILELIYIRKWREEPKPKEIPEVPAEPEAIEEEPTEKPVITTPTEPETIEGEPSEEPVFETPTEPEFFGEEETEDPSLEENIEEQEGRNSEHLSDDVNDDTESEETGY